MVEKLTQDLIDLNNLENKKLKYPLVEKIKKDVFVPEDIYKYKIVNEFFRNLEKEKVMKVVSIISRYDKISLRLCDWFVTNYSVINNVNIYNNNKKINVHSSYKAQLLAYRKTNFDPFRRNKSKNNCKFYYAYDKNNKHFRVLTTIAQLNFFKWAIENNIISYIDENYDKLNREMVKLNKIPTVKKQKLIPPAVKKSRNKLLTVTF